MRLFHTPVSCKTLPERRKPNKMTVYSPCTLTSQFFFRFLPLQLYCRPSFRKPQHPACVPVCHEGHSAYLIHTRERHDTEKCQIGHGIYGKPSETRFLRSPYTPAWWCHACLTYGTPLSHDRHAFVLQPVRKQDSRPYVSRKHIPPHSLFLNLSSHIILSACTLPVLS